MSKFSILAIIQANIFAKYHLPLIKQKALVKDNYLSFLNPQQSYGVLSACRRAALVNILFNIFAENVPGTTELINSQDLFYLQIVSLFAHSVWENKLNDEGILTIKVNCENFLKSIGAPYSIAHQFAQLLDPAKTHFQDHKQHWLSLILNSADSLNDMRRANIVYDLNTIPLFIECKKINKQNVMEDLAKDILAMMKIQNDISSNGVQILCEEILIYAIDNPRPKAKKKQAYEYSDNCYGKVIKDINQFPLLAKYYKNDAFLLQKVDLIDDPKLTQRNEIRNSAPTKQIENDYIFKSLRGDSANYFLDFVDGAISPHVKHPLRIDSKGLYTVDGKGPHLRSEKKSTYTKEQKKNYSKKQSVTYGMPDFQPNPFNFSCETIKTVGVIFFSIKKNALLANHLLTRDAGSHARPNDFDSLAEAEQYFKHRSNNTLFALDNIEDFKAALRSDKMYKYHNEVLAHLRLTADDSWQIFINADTLEARLLAQIYAKLIYLRLKKQGECSADYEIKLCYYMPKSALHLKQYTKQEQKMDISEALDILKNNDILHEKALENNFEFLLFLQDETVMEYLNKKIVDQTLMIKILSHGYLHILDFLVELKMLKSQTLTELTDLHIKGVNNANTLIQIAYYAMKKDKKFIFQQALQALSGKAEYAKCINDKIDIPDGDTNLLQMAFFLQKENYIAYLLQLKFININQANSEGNTLLHFAVSTGKESYVKLALTLGANINALNNQGGSALHFAVASGHRAIVRLLLSEPTFKQFDAEIKYSMSFFSEKFSILKLAAFNDQVEVLKILYQDGRFDFKKTYENERTLLSIAENNPRTLAYLLTLAEIDFKKKDDYSYFGGQNALHKAAARGFVDIVKMLIDKGMPVNDTCLNRKQTALHYAVENVDIDDMTSIENRMAIAALLLAAGIEKNALNKRDESALALAVSENCTPLIKMLVEKGCKLKGFSISLFDAAITSDNHAIPKLIKYKCQTSVEEINRFFKPEKKQSTQDVLNDRVEESKETTVTPFIP